MIKKILVNACVLSALGVVVVSANAENKIVPVEKCSVVDKLTYQPVKYIGDDLFLDADGNYVQPCSKNDEVHFKSLYKYEDGKTIFNESPSPILNPSKENDAIISINMNIGYDITYGDKTLEVKDVEGFKQQVKEKELDSTAKINPLSATSDDFQKTVFETLTNLNHESLSLYENAIDAEKTKAIQEKYAAILDKIKELQDSEKETAKNTFIDYASKNNKIYIVDKSVIKLYPERKDGQEYLPNGISYILFENLYKGVDFLSATQEILRNYLIGDYTLTEKLQFVTDLENARWQDLIKNTKDFNMASFDDDVIKLAESNNKGQQRYLEANAAKKEQYENAINEVNKKILNEEYEIFPDKITKGQYNALSDIDKIKYSPQVEGRFINKNFYHKKFLEEIQNLEYEDKNGKKETKKKK